MVKSLEESPAAALEKILKFGGFPEPYLQNDETYAKRWRRTHLDTIIRGDLLDLERVRDLQVSVHTVKHWLQVLENLCVIFAVRPYHRNIARSILKEAKYYFYDTGAVEGDMGPRLVNAVAVALLREMHLLEDTTGARTALQYPPPISRISV